MVTGDKYRKKNRDGTFSCKRCAMQYYDYTTPCCTCEAWYILKKRRWFQRAVMISALIFFGLYSFFAIVDGYKNGHFTIHGGVAILLMFGITGLNALFDIKPLGLDYTDPQLQALIKEIPSGYLPQQKNHFTTENKVVGCIYGVIILLFIAMFAYILIGMANGAN